MYSFCQKNDIELIIVDIPKRKGRYEYASSFPDSLVQTMKGLGVEYIDSDSLFADFNGWAEMHVPHGTHHIAEFTHTMIGMAVGKRIAKILHQKRTYTIRSTGGEASE
jgi:hypothetical protein